MRKNKGTGTFLLFLPVLVVSIHDEALYAERALRAGAKGYIMKQEATEKMLTAVRRVLSGEIYLSDTMGERLLGKIHQWRNRKTGFPHLTTQ